MRLTRGRENPIGVDCFLFWFWCVAGSDSLCVAPPRWNPKNPNLFYSYVSFASSLCALNDAGVFALVDVALAVVILASVCVPL